MNAATAGSASVRFGAARGAAGARRQGGFTLLEIIVAFGILALGLTLLLGTLSGASRQLRDAGEAGNAALVAQSLLASHAELLTQPLRLDGSAENGRYRWQLDVTPWQDPSLRGSSAPLDPGAARLLHVRLDMVWGEGGPRQQLHLSTLRLALPPRDVELR